MPTKVNVRVMQATRSGSVEIAIEAETWDHADSQLRKFLGGEAMKVLTEKTSSADSKAS